MLYFSLYLDTGTVNRFKIIILSTVKKKSQFEQTFSWNISMQYFYCQLWNISLEYEDLEQ